MVKCSFSLVACLHSYVPISHAYVKFRGGQLAHENNEYLPHENYLLYSINLNL